MRERCLAESRLIKSKIIYKVHQGLPLSSQEEKYLKAWRDKISTSPKTLIEDCLVPAKPTTLRIKDLSNNDIRQFNELPRVELKRELHGDFALNDLLLEVS
jgi:coproporphyrinogen III oxidase-like Fe-S oxidoreductase